MGKAELVKYVWIDGVTIKATAPPRKPITVTLEGRVWNDSGHPILLMSIKDDYQGRFNRDGPQEDERPILPALQRIGACETVGFNARRSLVASGPAQPGGGNTITWALQVKFRYEGKVYQSERVTGQAEPELVAPRRDSQKEDTW